MLFPRSRVVPSSIADVQAGDAALPLPDTTAGMNKTPTYFCDCGTGASGSCVAGNDSWRTSKDGVWRAPAKNADQGHRPLSLAAREGSMQFAISPLSAGATADSALTGSSVATVLAPAAGAGGCPCPFFRSSDRRRWPGQPARGPGPYRSRWIDDRLGRRCPSGNDRHREGQHGLRAGFGRPQQGGPGLSAGNWNAVLALSAEQAWRA